MFNIKEVFCVILFLAFLFYKNQPTEFFVKNENKIETSPINTITVNNKINRNSKVEEEIKKTIIVEQHGLRETTALENYFDNNITPDDLSFTPSKSNETPIEIGSFINPDELLAAYVDDGVIVDIGQPKEVYSLDDYNLNEEIVDEIELEGNLFSDELFLNSDENKNEKLINIGEEVDVLSDLLE